MITRPAGGLALPDETAVIRVLGARVHNLRDVDVALPRDRLVVLTGVSGSGKSSLAFDTLFAEGQRRFLDSLSLSARQFLDPLDRPDVDAIEGLPPTVMIDQRAGLPNPRSTVATLTEIHDFLRLLYARTGQPSCPTCGRPIRRQTPEQMVTGVLGLAEGTKVLVLAPLARGRKGQNVEAFRAIRRAGLLRARVDGEMMEVRDDPSLAKTKGHDIEAVVDRLVVRPGIRPRLAESLGLALKLGEGTVILAVPAAAGEGWEDRPLSVHYACTHCGTGFEELEPRTFSFNSPYGACPQCDGLGTVAAFDPELVVPDRSRSLASGAVAAWGALGPRARAAAESDPALGALLKRSRKSPRSPLSAWPPALLEKFLHGDPASGYEGVLPGLERELQRSRNERRRDALAAFRTTTACPGCGGARLRPEARSVRLGGEPIHEATARSVREARAFLAGLTFPAPLDQVGPPIVAELDRRLAFLDEVGVSYLTLDRPADTLSGGELQRVRLARQIGTGLVGACFLLDEPTAGLHPRDTGQLLGSLVRLRDQGNSVVVVEHDESVIRAADWVIDLGPGAGPDGGRVIAAGPPDALAEHPESVTARYLRGEAATRPGPSNRLARSPGWLEVRGAAAHNLRRVDVRIPLGTLTCVTGVSGSGKSTLVEDVLARAVRRRLGLAGPAPGAFDRIEGLGAIDKLIVIDQAPIGRTPASTPATYTGLFPEIRKVFARTREAKVRGFGPDRFSFNARGGRCEACQGQGVRRVEMKFLPDLLVRCEECGGQRFNRSTLAIRYKGKSIADVLALRVDEAIGFFEAIPRVLRGLEALHDAGLGYVTLGQSSTTLSGGEAQRVKLAAELGRAATGATLFLLDEPTTGLHFADVANLLRVLERIADRGNTIVVIEHHLDVIRAADWVIDLGPGAGPDGGRVVAMGPPPALADALGSHTGEALRNAL